jgi:hypothetical protein
MNMYLTLARRVLVLSVALCAAIISAAFSPQEAIATTLTPSARIYWADSFASDESQARIQRANPDGTNVETLQFNLDTDTPYFIAVAGTRRELYWTNLRGVFGSSVDGGALRVIGGGQCTMGVALDVVRYKVYWTDECGKTIQRANLDGSGDEILLAGLSSPRGIAIDSAGAKIYWTETTGRVARANLDGSGVETLVTRSAFFQGIAIDPAAGKMYWAADGSVLRANLDGSALEQFVGSTDASNPIGVAIDREARLLYWTDTGRHAVRRTSLDGGPMEDVITGLDTPWGMSVENPDPPVAPPANDDFDAAAAVGGLPFTDVVNTNGATRAEDEPPGCSSVAERTVWYAYTPAKLTRVHIHADREIDVFTGSRDALSLVACGTDDASFEASPEATYYVRLSPAFGMERPETTVTFEDVSPVPSNDDFDGAAPISSLVFSDFVDTRFASEAADDPGCFGRGPTVWYRITPSEDMRLEAVAFDASGWDPTLSVYTGEPGSFAPVACNDTYFSDGSTHGGVDFRARAGVTYYFRVGAADGSTGGALSFFVQRPLEYNIKIDTTATVYPREGSVMVKGSLTCSRPAESGSFDVYLREKIGSRIVEGTGTATRALPCSPTRTHWKAVVQPQTPFSFRSGNATATAVNDQICDAQGCRALLAPAGPSVPVRLETS